jgi:hypothetical protein
MAVADSVDSVDSVVAGAMVVDSVAVEAEAKKLRFHASLVLEPGETYTMP